MQTRSQWRSSRQRQIELPSPEHTVEEEGDVNGSSSKDIISELDDDNLIQILSFLPTKDAVKTGILSKRWLSLWKHVPVINCKNNSFIDTNNFCSFVDTTLRLHRCQGLEKFLLSFDEYCTDDEDSRCISWINWAVLANVKEMDLQIQEGFIPPIQFYTCSTLKKLRLSIPDFDIPTPSPRINWPLLKVCRLECESTPDFVHSLISGSPMLESLEISNYNVLRGQLRITSPALKNLVLDCTFDLLTVAFEDSPLIIEAPYLISLAILGDWSPGIWFKNLSSLTSANIDTLLGGEAEEKEDDNKRMMKEMLESLSNVTELALGPYCIRSLPTMEDEGYSLPSLKSKKLTLSIDVWYQDFPMIAALLRSSCELESLYIHATGSTGYWFVEKDNTNTGKNYLRLCKEKFVCLVSHLKFVMITHLRANCGDEPIIVLLQFILKEACVLEKMVIHKECMSSKVHHKVLSFPKSSPRAMIQIS